ncbi:restriction endonuclease subunit S [Qipengyuania nanhaisediminis]|uniref:restriction endonuclease subunit S n=1 Tax=Qipengyuania nanhaisediminis TaxID=604088 RepID=UPI0038B2C239
MSDPSSLEKLLDGADVEWKPLGEVVKLEKGRQLNKELLTDDGLYPAYNGGLSHSGFTDQFNYSENKTIISQGGASAGFVNFVTSKFYANAHCYVVLPNEEKVLNRYAYHLLKQHQKRLMGKKHGPGIPALRASEILEIPTPIPCPEEPEKSLAIQGEIVRILNSFTELTAELTAELELRKKQYNHYRDQLLAFEEGEVEWMALGDLTRIKTGQSVNKRMIAENPGQFPVINSGREPLGFLDIWNTEDDPIGITSRGAGVGSVTWQGGRYFRGNLNYSVTIKSEKVLNVHYLYHVLEQFQPQIKALCTFDGIPALNAVNLKKLRIPILPLEDQARIASILDKFDTLTTSLSEGLPREIKLRQKQYEFYRDLLLSFPKPAKAAGE